MGSIGGVGWRGWLAGVVVVAVASVGLTGVGASGAAAETTADAAAPVSGPFSVVSGSATLPGAAGVQRAAGSRRFGERTYG